jgi:2,3-bisphosphoglycerate-independent phosphoglycerate mutase
MKTKNPVILIIRDGWGYRTNKNKNAIARADVKNNDFYWKNYPHGLLQGSGPAVGLPAGYQGNSEVGHITIGSGRIIFQTMMRIDQAIATGEFFKNKAFLNVVASCKKKKTALHLIGLLQDQGVHSHINHLLALLDLCVRQNFKNVLIHIITDGRDAPTTESLKHLRSLEKKLRAIGFGKIATVSGRYYAMDRDQRWQRTKIAYEDIALGRGEIFSRAASYIKEAHAQGIGDEFIKPGHDRDYSGFQTGDGLIFFNFRTDRPRQLTKAIVENKFTGFKRKKIKVNFVAMTEYYRPMKALAAFPDVAIKNILGEVLADHKYKQLRISETEKYAHVTFFFNSQKETPYSGETRILIKSPRVATYDLKPEMSAPLIAKRLVAELKKKKYDLAVVNLVNGDMVGHTGKIAAIIKGLEAVDKATGEIVTAGLANGYTSIIFADHGNAEDKTPKFSTSHTINPVPVMIVSGDSGLKKIKIKKNIGLQDIAPTVLKIMGVKKPKEMTGKAIF